MARSEQEKRNREAIQQRQQREAQFKEWYPCLTLHLWASSEGVQVDAYLVTGAKDGPRRRVDIAHATWHPKEVTEERCVQWAIGALSTWLQGKAEAAAEAVHSASQ